MLFTFMLPPLMPNCLLYNAVVSFDVVVVVFFHADVAAHCLVGGGHGARNTRTPEMKMSFPDLEKKNQAPQ